MNQLTRFTTATPLGGLFLLPLVLAWFTFAPTLRAVDPPPDGGYAKGNTAEGTNALFSLTTGRSNTAIGFHSLFSNTTGGFNTADGASALLNNTIGKSNTAIGFFALTNNTTGSYNTANGDSALSNNTIGTSNAATGFFALMNNTTGSNNTALGATALENSTTGDNNIALGFGAGANLTAGSNNIFIGASGAPSESNAIHIGKVGTQKSAYIQGIYGEIAASGVQVIVGPKGKLGTNLSSARYKEAIKPMGEASEAILALQPVTFRYKHKLDPDGIPQFGLVAEQVEKVNRDLVARDEDGKPYTVRYEAVNAMLLNEFLKEHKEVQSLKATIAKQQKQIEALSASFEKMSYQREIK